MGDLPNSLEMAEQIVKQECHCHPDDEPEDRPCAPCSLRRDIMVALNKFERQGITIGHERCIEVISVMEKNANEGLDTLRDAGITDDLDVQRGRSIALHQALGAIESSRPKVLARFVSEEQAALKQIEDGMKGLTDA